MHEGIAHLPSSFLAGVLFLPRADAYGPSQVLNSKNIPFDAYRLMKGSSITFLVVMTILYFSLLSILVAGVGSAFSRDGVDYTPLSDGGVYHRR